MQNFVGPHKVANTIRMLREAGCRAPIVIVEGPSDARFLSKFVSSDVRVQTAFEKSNALAALSMVSGYDGIVALVDADFEHLLGFTRDDSRVFMTDLHDIECMLVESPALDVVLTELGSQEKITAFVETHGDLRSVLTTGARELGVLLLAALPNNKESNALFLGLCFTDLSFREFVDKTSLAVNRTALVRCVKNRSQRQDLDEELALQALSTHHANLESEDCWQLCRGHDLVAILHCGLCTILGSQHRCQLTKERLESDLRIAYTVDSFRQTKLYMQLVAWERDHPGFAILAI